MITQTWTPKMIAVVVGSVAIWFVFVVVYSVLYQVIRMSAFYDFFYVGINILRTPSAWVSLPLVVAMAVAPDAAWHFYRRMYLPTSPDIIREWESGHGVADERVLDAMEGLPSVPAHSSARQLVRRAAPACAWWFALRRINAGCVQSGGRLRSVASSAPSVSHKNVNETSNSFVHHAAQMKDLQSLQRAVRGRSRVACALLPG